MFLTVLCFISSVASLGLNPNSTELYTKRFCGMFDGKKDNCDKFIEKEHLEYGSNLSCYSCEKELCNESNFLTDKLWIVVISVTVGIFLVRTS